MFRRMREGWELTKKSWSVVRQHPRMLRLTITGGLMAMLVAVIVGGPGLWLSTSDIDSTRYAGWALLAVASYAASFFVIYYNVALAAAADEALAGREPDLRAATARARGHLPAIAGWALVSMIVALLINGIRDKGGNAGRILGAVGAAAWGFVTFFVVPVLALEGIGPIAAMKRSAQLVRQKWGQQATGNIAIGGFATAASMLGGIVLVVGVVLLVSGATANIAIGVVLVAVGGLIVIASSVVAGAMRGVFGVALYHFGVDDEARGPFDRAELAAAAS
jgi:hypothetical protein